MNKSVTPLAGVWIERLIAHFMLAYTEVTPLAGVWIEIVSLLVYHSTILSLPLRECGLKSINRKAVCY